VAASYPALIELRVNGITQVTRVLDTIQKLDAALVSIKNTPIAIDSGNATDGIRVLKKEYMGFVAGLSQGKTQLASTTAGINQQAAAMRLLAANAKIGGQAFNQLVQGAEQARQKVSLTAGLAEIAAVASQVKVGRTAPTQSFRGVEELLKMEKIIPKNTASLKLFQSELLHTISFVDIGGKDFQQLSQAIDRVGLSLDLAAGKAQKFGPMLPPGFTEQGRKFEANAYPFPVGPSPASTRRRFSGDTSVERAEGALRTKELQTQRALNVKFFAEEKAQVLELDRLRAASAQKQTQRIQGIGKAVQGSLSSAAIGGAFPLLFGQSPQAAVGGAIGGLLGGAGGGFAGSLLGTALGELEAAKARTKELAVELGLSSTQAKTLATAFELAGRNSQQLEAAVTNIQGLGLSTQETASAIKIAVELSKEYGGSVEKIAQSFADTLESGKVSITTLNKFTAQGIPIQDELAKKFGVSRTKLLEMAKGGEISVQQLTDALVKMGREAEATADKGETGFDRFTRAVRDISTAIASAAGALLKILIPALDAVLTKLSAVINRATQAINLVTNAQVGEASSALFRSGATRGIFGGFAQSKGTIDDLTGGLKTLNPLLATNKEQLDTIAAVAQRYRTELSNFGGSVGKYAEGTAQVELSRVQRDIAARATALKVDTRVPAAAQITDINAPANLPPSGGSSKKAADDAKRREEEARRLREQIEQQIKAAASLKAQQQGSLAILRTRNDFEKAFVEFSVNRAAVQRRYEELALQSKSTAERALLTEARALEFKQNSLELQKQIAELTTQATAPLDDIVSKLKDQVAFEREYGELIKNGTNPELAKQIIEINRAYEASAAALVPALAAAQAAVTRAEAEGASATEIQKYREQLERIQEIQSGLPAKKTDAISAATELAKPKTDQQNITEKIATLKKEITDLTSISNIAITSAEGIGNAFAQSFQGLISGTMTAKEALGSFFKSVADMFLEMAAQIIAKQITMIILQTILKALGAVGGIQSAGSSAGSAAFGGSGPTFNPEAFSMPKLAANGATFANGIAQFANGGAFTNSIVSSPTMFKFANGGAMRTGLMGEAGPEAIMPLKRGADGSLGVQANGLREAMDRQQGGGSGSPVLNMSFQSTNINGVEYVSREQLESAMAETRRASTRDGAKRGMTMTLDRIQNSSSTRRKVGI
jgi:lambda family phage tail tape measure protein